MTILSTEPPLIPRRRNDKEDREQATGPLTRLAVREALEKAFTDVVDDVRLAEVDGMAHVYVSIRPATSACPERIRTTAREAYRAVCGEAAVAHVVVSCPVHRRWWRP
ncbi:hypothetical protein OG320_26940 [Microbispora sp. NBC_01189]|uniref:hypothetical protein n=1 Tax=unclassified Microbispora TaxID=2614687 RepID=UPI002E110805|nr:hypothetical protein OG320_26940 [Microbispora sp. NBC_01189]